MSPINIDPDLIVKFIEQNSVLRESLGRTSRHHVNRVGPTRTERKIRRDIRKASQRRNRC